MKHIKLMIVSFCAILIAVGSFIAFGGSFAADSSQVFVNYGSISGYERFADRNWGDIPQNGSNLYSVKNSDVVYQAFCAQPIQGAPFDGVHDEPYSFETYNDNAIYKNTGETKSNILKYIMLVSPIGPESLKGVYQFPSYLRTYSDDYRIAHSMIGLVYDNDPSQSWSATGIAKLEEGILEIVSLFKNNSQYKAIADSYRVFRTTNAPSGIQDVVWIEPYYGTLKIKKVDADTGLTAPQGDVESFAGTEFGAYRGDSTTPEKTLTINGSGIASNSELLLETYIIKETKAVDGYSIEDNSQTASFSQTNATIDITNSPFTDHVWRGNIKVKKCDTETRECHPLGGASLEGITFNIVNKSINPIYYNGKTIAKDATVDTKVTDSNGEIIFSNLPYGTYEIKETSTNESYLLTDTTPQVIQIRNNGETKEAKFYDQVKRGDLKFVKTEGSTMEVMSNVAFEIKSNTNGEKHIVVTDENGYINTSNDWNSHSYNTNGYDALTSYSNQDFGTWFGQDKNGNIAPVSDSLGALPFDTYTVTEIRCEANASCKTLNGPKIVTIKRNNTIVELGTWDNNCDEEPEPEPTIDTKLVDDADNDKEVKAEDNIKLRDTIDYCIYTELGVEYEALGILMNKETNEPLLVNGETVTASTKFIPENNCGTIEVIFELNASDLAEMSVVAFQGIYKDGIMIVFHEDINDPDQTIVITNRIEVDTPDTGKATTIHNGIEPVNISICLGCGGAVVVIVFMSFNKIRRYYDRKNGKFRI